MKTTLLMGIDIGTQSSRAALLDTTGRVLAAAGKSYNMQTPRPGWAEQDPEVWWRITIENIREIITKAGVSPGQIAAIGVGGQMHGTVPLASDGGLLSHSVQLWCDTRSAEIVDNFKASPNAAAAYKLAGSPPVANWIGFKIKWLKENDPNLYANTWKFVVPKDFINYRLTGAVSTDYSEASGSFLMDAGTNQWSPELIEQLDIDADKLPNIHPSAAVIGHVTDEAARLIGLSAGTPVVAGGGDMLCTLLAAGITKPGRASDLTGTSSILSVFTETPVLDERLMNLHHVMPGWIPFGITDSGGVCLKWFRDSFCQEEVAQAKAQNKVAYNLLTNLAAAIEPGSEGLLFFPYLMGERTLGTTYARGVFFGLTPRSGKGAMVRAIMEGVTFELKRTLDIVENAGHTVEAVYHSGGGAYSSLWSQIKADIYQKPVYTFETSEGGLLGAAILAGVGVGIYPNEAYGVEQCLRVDKKFTPNPTLAERYNYLFNIFKEVHDKLQSPFNQLAKML